MRTEESFPSVQLLKHWNRPLYSYFSLLMDRFRTTLELLYISMLWATVMHQYWKQHGQELVDWLWRHNLMYIYRQWCPRVFVYISSINWRGGAPSTEADCRPCPWAQRACQTISFNMPPQSNRQRRGRLDWTKAPWTLIMAAIWWIYLHNEKISTHA